MAETGTLPAWCRETWERLANSRWSGVAVYDSPCHPLQRKRELDAMLTLAKHLLPRHVAVEIGTSRGGGVFHWAIYFDRVAGYDINGQPYADVLQEMFPGVDFHFQHASSLEPQSIAWLREWLAGDPIDVLFIDGQKTGGAFRKDFDNHLPLMSENGIVFMHDIQSTAAMDWRGIEESKRWVTARIIDTSESVEAVQRMLRGEPATTAYEKWLRGWRGRSAGVGVVFLGAACGPS